MTTLFTPDEVPYLPMRSISSSGFSFMFIGLLLSPVEDSNGFVYVPTPELYAFSVALMAPSWFAAAKLVRALPSDPAMLEGIPPSVPVRPPGRLVGLFRQLVIPDPPMVPVKPEPAIALPKLNPDTLLVRFWRLLCSPDSVLDNWPMLLTIGADTGFVNVTW